jgi:hypothetical protein
MAEITQKKEIADEVHHAAEALVELYGMDFAGKRPGKYRISRRFLRDLTGRRRLPEWYIRELFDVLFEEGYVLIDLESYLVVIKQTAFASTRRVTVAAIADVLETKDNHRIFN